MSCKDCKVARGVTAGRISWVKNNVPRRHRGKGSNTLHEWAKGHLENCSQARQDEGEGAEAES